MDFKKAYEKIRNLDITEKNLTKKKSKEGKSKVKEVKASSLIKSFANEKRQLVKEVPERIYSNDNRSLFFNSEMNKELKRIRGF